MFDPRDMRCIASWSGVTPTPMASSGDENMPSVKNFKGFEIGNGLESYLHATLSPSAPQLFSPSQGLHTFGGGSSPLQLMEQWFRRRQRAARPSERDRLPRPSSNRVSCSIVPRTSASRPMAAFTSSTSATIACASSKGCQSASVLPYAFYNIPSSMSLEF